MGGQIEKFLANATPYMFTLGHTVIAWLWLEQGIVLQQKLQESPDSGYYLGKRSVVCAAGPATVVLPAPSCPPPASAALAPATSRPGSDRARVSPPMLGG